MYYIIAAHGPVQKDVSRDAEMVTGTPHLLFLLHLLRDMTKEDVEKKYEKILAERGAEECKAIIADLPGGTPYNAAMRITAEHKNISYCES